MRLLTEVEAWEEIAGRIAAGQRDGYGLCCEAEKLWSSAQISVDMLDSMYDRVNGHLAAMSPDAEESPRKWGWPKGEAEPRILAALFLAHEAADEGC